MTSNLRDLFRLKDQQIPVNEIVTCNEAQAKTGAFLLMELKKQMREEEKDNDKKFYELVCPCSKGDQFKCSKHGCNNNLLFYNASPNASPNTWCPLFAGCELSQPNEGVCYFSRIDAGEVIKK